MQEQLLSARLLNKRGSLCWTVHSATMFNVVTPNSREGLKQNWDWGGKLGVTGWALKKRQRDWFDEVAGLRPWSQNPIQKQKGKNTQVSGEPSTSSPHRVRWANSRGRAGLQPPGTWGESRPVRQRRELQVRTGSWASVLRSIMGTEMQLPPMLASSLSEENSLWVEDFNSLDRSI